jgi:hypothetical protein
MKVKLSRRLDNLEDRLKVNFLGFLVKPWRAKIIAAVSSFQ